MRGENHRRIAAAQQRAGEEATINIIAERGYGTPVHRPPGFSSAEPPDFYVRDSDGRWFMATPNGWQRVIAPGLTP